MMHVEAYLSLDGVNVDRKRGRREKRKRERKGGKEEVKRQRENLERGKGIKP